MPMRSIKVGEEFQRVRDQEVGFRTAIPNSSAHMSDKLHISLGFQDSRVASGDGMSPVRQRNDRFGFFRRVSLLVGQKMSWSPSLLAGEFRRYLLSIGKRREVLRLLKHRPFSEIVQNEPRFAFKYLAPDYLARSFTVKERVSCFLHHYRRIYAAFPESLLRQILQGVFTLCEINKDGHHFSLSIGVPELMGDREGELSLAIQVDGRNVFILSFTIVPGWVVKSESAEVLLITRMQGMKGCRSQIGLLRSALNEHSPEKLLFAALQGIADAFGIDRVVGVCVSNQRSFKRESAGALMRKYDHFFAGLGMVKATAGFYSAAVPIDERPIASYKGRYRSHVRKRRAFRQHIHLACAAALLEATKITAPSSSAAVSSTEGQGKIDPLTKDVQTDAGLAAHSDFLNHSVTGGAT